MALAADHRGLGPLAPAFRAGSALVAEQRIAATPAVWRRAGAPRPVTDLDQRKTNDDQPKREDRRDQADCAAEFHVRKKECSPDEPLHHRHLNAPILSLAAGIGPTVGLDNRRNLPPILARTGDAIAPRAVFLGGLAAPFLAGAKED